ncbi:MAG: YidH family protein [Candidatus Limnocylindrales bacterium]
MTGQGGRDPKGDQIPQPSIRDHLANERTFLAWTRTAITVMALGFVVAKFGILLREIGGASVHLLTVRAGAVVGILLVVSGLVLLALALHRFLRLRRGIESGGEVYTVRLDVVLAVTVGVAGVLLAVYLLITT